MKSIPKDTLAKQWQASNPEVSAWVGANAGSGKTFVLAQRVVRLLFNGTDPSRILCLTFTKAAAAEMATRIFKILGDWALLDDQNLLMALTEIESKKPDRKKLSDARKLFARALETPGGLKIQTIHAFCEALLHQFPLEAGVSGHFSVLDERTQTELLEKSRNEIFQRATLSTDCQEGKNLNYLIGLMSDMGIEKSISEIIGKRDKFHQWVSSYNSLEEVAENLREKLKIGQNENLASVEDQFLNSPDFLPKSWESLAAKLAKGGKTDMNRAEKIREANQTESNKSKSELWYSVFYTQKGDPAKRLLTRSLQEVYPGLEKQLIGEQERLGKLEQQRRTVVAFEGTKSLIFLANSVLEEFKRLKVATGVLDFDDLVIHTASLLRESDAALWVQYKLDNGLDHILVDEAQDTSPLQWDLIEALASEFFVGSGARETNRTIFAVGDEKQSIYSFQGAEPENFSKMRKHFNSHAKNADKQFNDIQLNLSFRSTDDVLEAVDKVFAQESAYKGLSQDANGPVHEGIRRNEPGLVEVWPPELASENEPDEDWTVPIDREGPTSPIVRLADRLAVKIDRMVSSGQIRAGDILVLLRKRGPFIEALNRALKRKGIPIAGSDRLILTNHIAVKDLISLARFILLVDDELSLAEVLKSPLIGFNEDQLFNLANNRQGILYSELIEKSNTNEFYKVALEKLSKWRIMANNSSPFEFFSRLLGLEGIRSEFRGRLGLEVDDVLDEFLALTLEFESRDIPCLEGFISWIEATETQIKREFESETDAVRIMTVHGAKGLEAPIVFIVDSGTNAVHTSHDPAILEISENRGETGNFGFIWMPPKFDRPNWMQELLEKEREYSRNEYRRLLYVAMTRAKDQLYVCSWAPKSGPVEDCWYSLVKDALTTDRELESDESDGFEYWRWQKKTEGIKQVELNLHEKPYSRLTPLPAWIGKSVKPKKIRRKLVPSNALDLIGSTPPQSDEWTLSTVCDLTESERDDVRLRGTCLHQLFELLPNIEPEKRRDVAMRTIKGEFSSIQYETAEEIIKEVFQVLDNPDFATVFSASSKAEVAVAGTLKGEDGKVYDVMGQIDRLIVSEEEVLIVDFKSNRADFNSVEEIPLRYVAQLGIYFLLMKSYFASHKVRAAILWTRSAKLMEINEKLLTDVAGNFLSVQAENQ